MVFKTNVVVARDRKVDVECSCAIGFDIAWLVVASDADAFDRFMSFSREHFAIDTAVKIIAIVWRIACLKHECNRGNSESTKKPAEGFAVELTDGFHGVCVLDGDVYSLCLF